MASPPDPPSALPLPSSRRLPPPCWSPDETLALIHSYRDKWFSLGRCNLRATHWLEVADAISTLCPNVSPPKTPVQCRHKMEKLRKRYRTEIQRLPLSPFNSSWLHFNLMDSIDKGHNPPNPYIQQQQQQHQHLYDEDEEETNNDHGIHGSNTRRSSNKLYRNGFGGNSGDGAGFRIRIPTGLNMDQPQRSQSVSNMYGKVGNQRMDHHLNQNLNSGTPSYGARVMGKKRERDAVGEVVNAIKVLGDGFVRMEKMKMEMAKEIETIRMEMDMKRTEKILDSQHRIVEAFAKAVSEKKKKKNKNKPERLNDQQQQQP